MGSYSLYTEHFNAFGHGTARPAQSMAKKLAAHPTAKPVAASVDVTERFRPDMESSMRDATIYCLCLPPHSNNKRVSMPTQTKQVCPDQ